MAKGARASTKKANNTKLKSRVFGPVEAARTERLSAKLLELASQPKPKPVKEDVVMEAEDDLPEAATGNISDKMEVDEVARKTSNLTRSSSGRIQKRRTSRKASIVFPKYKNGKRMSRTKGKK